MAIYTVGDDYTSSAIQTAIDLIPGDLSGHGKEWVQTYSKSGGYAEQIDTITGFSNASDNIDYIVIEAMVSHGGLRGQGIVWDVGGAVEPNSIITGIYTHIKGFCITRSTWVAASTNTIFAVLSRLYVENNIIYDCNCDNGQSIYGIYVNWSGRISAYNNQFIRFCPTTGSYGQGVRIELDGTAGDRHWILNNSFVNLKGAGIDGRSKNYINVHNNYAYSTIEYGFYLLAGANNSITYNISSDASADDWGGTGNLVSKAAANQFVSVSAGSEDLHLKATADCFRNGADMSAYFTHDCVNIPRKFWRTGAFETLPTVYSVNDGNPHKVYYSWGSNLAKVDGVDVPLRNTETMTANDAATIEVGQYEGANQFGGLIGDLKIFSQPGVKDNR